LPNRVVIVDDHEMIVSALKRQVETLGTFQVVSTFVEMNRCRIWFETNDADILISDVYFDSASTLNSIPKIRKRLPKLKVILISGFFSEKISKRVSDLKVQGVWEKIQNLDVFTELFLNVAKLPETSFDSKAAPTLLTPREEEICILLAKGQSVKKAAKILKLADKTIEVHKSNIMSKIGAKNQNELIKWALSNGLVIA
jgi:DNA-binding NarL/FixJ family response regulator